ncbi:hypothetical protein [Oceanobacillus sojae]|uniref:hypothetical protein n=1 Tax=Oceanobacillus sojae TaxID=582851 RepID=UPI0036391B05
MSKEYYTVGEAAESLGINRENRTQVHELLETMGINATRAKNNYRVYSAESIEKAIIKKDIKHKLKITYVDLTLLEKIIENCSSRVEGVQKTFDILKNYDCTANNFYTLIFFENCCKDILGLTAENKELLEQITGDINIYPDENTTLQSLYDYHLYQAYVLDTVLNLSKLELEPEQEFWDLEVVTGYETYIFNTVFNRPPITEKINEFFMCIIMGVKYDTESKTDPIIKKLTLLLKKLNKFHDETKQKYDKCQHIFLHAILLLSLHIPANS